MQQGPAAAPIVLGACLLVGSCLPDDLAFVGGGSGGGARAGSAGTAGTTTGTGGRASGGSTGGSPGGAGPTGGKAGFAGTTGGSVVGDGGEAGASQCSNGEQRVCGTDVGSCQAGIQTCDNGSFGDCVGEVAPAAGDTCVCDNDDNCNGITNEGCACCNGTTEPCTPTAGACAGNSRTCSNGAWGACSRRAGTETCNRIDDNCNGQTDEGSVCNSCLSLPQVPWFPLAQGNGDAEFGGNGPAVTVTVTFAPSGNRVQARVCVTMLEMPGTSTGSACATVNSATVSGTVAQVLDANVTATYTDTTEGNWDTVSESSPAISLIRCAGDGPGNDICSDRAPPDCAGCEVTFGCVNVRRTPP